MKKLILICMIILCCTKTKACDICGCGVGDNYIGILPEFSKHIFGVRYRYNSLLTHIGAGGSTTYLTTTERYRTVEIWGGWNIGKKFRLMMSVPYSFNERINQGITKNKDGLGDISISGFYQLLNKRGMVHNDKLLIQNLWIGGGVKIPTGKYVPEDKAGINQNTNLFQLGTASVDFTINAMYDVRLQDAGINVSGSYKMNTSNKYDYSYGNKFSTAAQAYYKLRVKKLVTLAPNAGIIYETAKKDIDNKIMVDVSGGHILLGTIGLEANFKKFAVGANFQKPLSQDLANGFVKANNKGMVHFSYTF